MKLLSTIETLQRDVGSLSLRLQLERLTPSISQCDAYTTDIGTGSNNSTTNGIERNHPENQSDDKTLLLESNSESYLDVPSFQAQVQRSVTGRTKQIKERILKLPKAALYNHNGCITIALCTAAMMVEIYTIHKQPLGQPPLVSKQKGGDDGTGSRPWISQSTKFFDVFVARRKLLSNGAQHPHHPHNTLTSPHSSLPVPTRLLSLLFSVTTHYQEYNTPSQYTPLTPSPNPSPFPPLPGFAYGVILVLCSLAWCGLFTWSSFVPLLLKVTTRLSSQQSQSIHPLTYQPPMHNHTPCHSPSPPFSLSLTHPSLWYFCGTPLLVLLL